MKTLSNNKGVSLIVLIVAMTLIAILGASFVSLMGTKQKSVIYQTDSYRALNIANAGIEYAIRYASEGLDSSGNSIFFSDQQLSTIGKNFSGGTFSVVYSYSSLIDRDYINVTGTSKISTRQVRLSKFRRYISPLTLVPLASSRPSLSGNDAVVPIIANNESNFVLNRIDVTLPAPGSNTYLNILRGGSSVFNYFASSYPPCGPIPSPTCKDFVNGIYIAGNGSSGTIQFDLSSPNHIPDAIYTYTLRFSSIATAPAGQYIMKVYTSLPSGNPFTIQFSLP